MTYEQIEKGLEFCINNDICDCYACPYNEELLCVNELKTDCLAYINRLKAEKAALIKEADNNAALAMEQKLRADRLETQLQACLEKAYEHNEEECKRCITKVIE